MLRPGAGSGRRKGRRPSTCYAASPTASDGMEEMVDRFDVELLGLMPLSEATSETQKRQSRWRVRPHASLLSMFAWPAFWLLSAQIPHS